MTSVTGRIGKKDAVVTFEDGAVTFKHKSVVLQQMKSPWFVYFQRVSKRLKTCDMVVFDGVDMVEFSTRQTAIETIRDVVPCACYMGGLDPLPWKRILRDAQKHHWDKADWQHHLEGDSSESESDSDADWIPDDESESDSDADWIPDDESESSDHEPEAKRRRVVSGQSDLDSASE